MMNRQMDVPAMQRIMRDYAMNNERMEMTEEMMGDAIDDVMEEEGDEEEEENIVGQVLAELGVEADAVRGRNERVNPPPSPQYPHSPRPSPCTQVPDAPGGAVSSARATASAGAAPAQAAVTAGPSGGGGQGGQGGQGGGNGGGGGGQDAGTDELEARLHNLRK